MKENVKENFRKTVFSQTIPQEIFNSILHGVGALLSIAAIVLLAVFAAYKGSAIRVVSFVIYGTTLLLLFLSSTLYHSLRPFKAKALFLRFDHISIYLLIAGTYTPISLVAIGGWKGWTIFGIVWGLAVIGTIIKCFWDGSNEWLSVLLYVLMGWIIIFDIKTVFTHLQTNGIILLFAGGIAYTVGTFFFFMERIPFSHAIWHLFVLGGAISHFFCILLFV